MSAIAALLHEQVENATPARTTDQIYRALVDVSSPDWPLDPALLDRIDWEDLLRQARHHSLSPLLAHRLLESRAPIPRDIRTRLKSDFQANLHRNFSLLEEALRIARVFRDRGIDVIPYKGPVLAEQLWGSFALRECSDLDLLVPRANVNAAGSVLRDLSYLPVSPISDSLRPSFVRNASEEQFHHCESNILLELQWAPAPRGMAIDFDEESLWRNKQTVSIAGETLTTPSPEDLFALLAIHGWKHNWSKLVWVADLAQVMRRHDLDWDLLHRSARRGRWDRILRLAVAMVERVYGVALSPALRPDPKLALLADQLAADLREAKNHGYLEWHRHMLSARDDRFSQIRQVATFFFTPGLADYECVELPAWASPGYRLVRIARLLRFGPGKGLE
jgi:hypothetical protein